jgi:hypothetical protein
MGVDNITYENVAEHNRMIPYIPGFPVKLNVFQVYAKKTKRFLRKSVVKYYALVDLEFRFDDWRTYNPLCQIEDNLPRNFVEISELMYHRILIQRDNNIKDSK